MIGLVKAFVRSPWLQPEGRSPPCKSCVRQGTRMDGVKVWDTLAIGEYLHELRPASGLLPADRGARAHCRAICGEMHSGFASVSHTFTPSCVRQGTRMDGDISRISLRACASSGGTVTSSNSSPTNRAISQPRSDHDE